MSAIDKLLPDTAREPKIPQVAVAENALKFLAGTVRRRFPIIVSSIVLMSALGLVYVRVVSPSFTARAVIAMDPTRIHLFQPQQPTFDLSQSPIDSPMVDSQVEILKSESVLAPVVRKLRLDENPEFVKRGWFGSFFRSDATPMQVTLRALGNSLDVKRVRLTNVIEIGVRSRDPQLAANIANEIAHVYVDDEADNKYRRASAWFEARAAELRERASAAERAVVEFKAKNHIVDADGRLVDEQQVEELNSALVAARTHISETSARLDRIESIIASDPADAPVDATVTDTMKSPVVTTLRTRYFELANREANLSSRYGRNHLVVIDLRNKMRDIRNSIADELRRLAETYKSDFEIAKKRQDDIQKQLTLTEANLQQENQAQITLRDLESTARSYRALYDAFIQRSIEAIQQQSFPVADARLITPASRPSQPKTLLGLIVAALAGAILGLGVAVLADRSDRISQTGKAGEQFL